MLKVFSKALLASATVASVVAGGAIAQGHSSSTEPAFQLESVQVQDPKVVDVTFNNPLSSTMTDLALRVFHAPHWNHDTPHSHEASSVVLINGAKTARVTLGRALHSEDPPCDNDLEPRCSDDKLDFVITDATDIYGHRLSDDDWRVWAVGSKD